MRSLAKLIYEAPDRLRRQHASKMAEAAQFIDAEVARILQAHDREPRRNPAASGGPLPASPRTMIIAHPIAGMIRLGPPR